MDERLNYTIGGSLNKKGLPISWLNCGTYNDMLIYYYDNYKFLTDQVIKEMAYYDFIRRNKIFLHYELIGKYSNE